MRILVTGASGFVGSLLVPALHTSGHNVRILARNPNRVLTALARTYPKYQVADPAATNMVGGLTGPPTGEPIEDPERLNIVLGDVLTADGLDQALDGVDVAYYLIHSMEPPAAAGSPFSDRELVAAENFAIAANRASLRRIIYLGGLIPRQQASTDDKLGSLRPPISRHLASRQQVERVLLAAVADSLALRASIVVGARSRSFRLLVHLVERMPVLALPAWHSFRTQPIDSRDVTAILAACATSPLSARHLDIGGPDVLTYGQMLTRIAEAMLVNRPTVKLRVNLTAITARLAAAVASEDPELVVPLMEGLQGDLLPAEHHAAELLGIQLHSFDSAVGHALAEWESFEPLAAR